MSSMFCSTRKERNQMIDLRLGDCLEVMKTIPDNSVDLVLTDPPYGIGVACKELGRNFIGIEINEKYFKIAERRINQTMENLL
uniref:Putative methyltransferase n=1 Tax=viral metagenome TaxID=1070528 RepID=A0A6M3IWH8_9ZZZZ